MAKQESKRKLTLPATALANIAEAKMEHDFTFIVGDHRYDCAWFVADLLSPRIGRLHAIDPTVIEFEIKTSDPGAEFNSFLSLGRGSTVSVTDSNRDFFLSVSAELENFDFYWLLSGVGRDGVTVSAFCEHFKDIANWDWAPDQAIDFIASHFISRISIDRS
jgi:hypothetical protein